MGLVRVLSLTVSFLLLQTLGQLVLPICAGLPVSLIPLWCLFVEPLLQLVAAGQVAVPVGFVVELAVPADKLPAASEFAAVLTFAP